MENDYVDRRVTCRKTPGSVLKHDQPFKDHNIYVLYKFQML